MEARTTKIGQLTPMFTKVGVGIAILLIAWLVVANLPMIDRIPFPMDFSLSELLKAIVLISIVAVLLNFGGRLERRLTYMFPHFPEGGRIIKMFVYIISILITYFALSSLIIIYLGSYDWIYHLLFLVGFLVVLAIMSFTIYGNMEQLGQLFSGASPKSGPVCAKCGEIVPQDARFCNLCGTKAPEALVCSVCKIPLKANAQFCPGCGTSVDNSSKPPPQANMCATCNTPLKPDAKFCPGCGSPAEGPGKKSNSDPDPPQPNECETCHAPLKPGAKFCPGCGQAASPPKAKEVNAENLPPPICSVCGGQLSDQAKFCPACGAPSKTQEEVAATTD